MPCFYTVSLVYFVAGLAKAKPTLREVFPKTWHRLVLPYLAWTAIYTGLQVAKTVLLHGSHEFSWWCILLYGGGAVQLYFLPILLLLQCLALALYLLFRVGPTQWTTGGLLLGGLAYLSWGIYYHCFGIPTVGSFSALAFIWPLLFGWPRIPAMVAPRLAT